MVLKSIILSKKNFGEGHINITLLSRESGIVTASAFGGKKISQRFKGNLDYFNVIDVEVDNSHKGYTTITGIKDVECRFASIPCDINKYASACYVLEICSALLIHNDICGKSEKTYFDLALEVLYKIESTKVCRELFDIVFDFHVMLLQQTGFLSSYLPAPGIRSKFLQLEQLNIEFTNKIPKSFRMLETLTRQS